jgi:hypothetical protein
VNCLDCALDGIDTTAVGICTDCGGAVCLLHAVVTAQHRTVDAALNRRIAIDPPARVLRCSTCDAADRATGKY